MRGGSVAAVALVVIAACDSASPVRMLGVATSAMAAPVVGPEFPLDPPVPSVAYGEQLLPAVAAGNTTWLVAWLDSRVAYREVYTGRIDASGNLLDPSGLRVAGTALGPGGVAVAFDGTNYFVVWSAFVQVGSNSYQNVVGARVSEAGQLLNASPIQISHTVLGQWTPDAAEPAVAFDGTNYLVVWSDCRNDLTTCRNTARSTADVYGARVTPAGYVLDPGGIAISTAAYSQARPAVTSDGTNFFVVWQDCRNGSAGSCQLYLPDVQDVYGARVDPNGVVLDPGGIAISVGPSPSRGPTATFDGANFVAAWRQDASPWPVRAARVSGAGTVLDPSGVDLSAGGSQTMDAPALMADPSGAFAAWSEASAASGLDLFYSRLDGAAQPFDVPALPLSQAPAAQSGPVAACGQPGCLAAWTDGRPSGWPTDIYAARVDRTAGVLDPGGVLVSQAAADERFPELAFTQGTYLAAWEDRRSSAAAVRAVRVDALGTVLDAASFAISSGPEDARFPAVAATQGQLLVAWQSCNANSCPDIRAARVDPSGQVLDPAGIVVATSSNVWRPAAAGAGTTYLAVWSDGARLLGARVDTAGTVLDSPPLVLDARLGEGSYAVGSSGSAFLVLWSDFPPSAWPASVLATRIDASGAVLDVPPMTLGTLTFLQPWLCVASDGNAFFAVWPADSAGPWPDARFARIDALGNDLDPGGALLLSGTSGFDVCGFDGIDYLVATIPTGYPYSPLGLRVRTDGTIVDPTGFPLPILPTAFAADGAGRGLLAYSRFDGTVPLGSTRARARTFVETDVVGAADAGTVDAGAADAGTADAGTLDGGAGPDDGGTPDAAADGGPPLDGGDAGGVAVDAGVPDAGADDAGAVDAGMGDAGAATDAGASDGGAGQGGSDAGVRPHPAHGCGCGSGADGAGLTGLAALLALRRRSRRSPRRSKATPASASSAPGDALARPPP